jgi:hypothetical protein
MGIRSPLAGGQLSKTDIFYYHEAISPLSDYDEQDILNKKYCKIIKKYVKVIAYIQYIL